MTLLEKVKANLILEHSEDDVLLEEFIKSAVDYAERFQHVKYDAENGSENKMPPTTEQAIVVLSSHFYESRDGSTGGFFADNVNASQRVWDVVNRLLRQNKKWSV